VFKLWLGQNHGGAGSASVSLLRLQTGVYAGKGDDNFFVSSALSDDNEGYIPRFVEARLEQLLPLRKGFIQIDRAIVTFGIQALGGIAKTEPSGFSSS
jgi:hypothetical protein